MLVMYMIDLIIYAIFDKSFYLSKYDQKGVPVTLIISFCVILVSRIYSLELDRSVALTIFITII